MFSALASYERMMPNSAQEFIFLRKVERRPAKHAARRYIKNRRMSSVTAGWFRFSRECGTRGDLSPGDVEPRGGKYCISLPMISARTRVSAMVSPASSDNQRPIWGAKASGGIDGEDGGGQVSLPKMVQERRPHPCGLQGHLEGWGRPHTDAALAVS